MEAATSYAEVVDQLLAELVSAPPSELEQPDVSVADEFSDGCHGLQLATTH